MARQDVNIGVEGNDGTGDSIRESFRKVNENFREIYAVFGQGGQISFLNLNDTPDTLVGQGGKITAVRQDELGLEFYQLVSDTGNDNPNDVGNSIKFIYEGNKLKLIAANTKLSQDPAPVLNAPLNASDIMAYDTVINTALLNSGAGRDINDMVADWNASHPSVPNITASNVVISKGYADLKYVNVSGDTLTGHLNTIAGATGNQVPRRNEVVGKSGDTMTGPLVLYGSPIADLEAATKEYVDNNSFSSTVNFFVSTSGRTKAQMISDGVPTSKIGRAWAYAFSSLGEACYDVEEVIFNSKIELGAYAQPITNNSGASLVLTSIIPTTNVVGDYTRISMINNSGSHVDQGNPLNNDLIAGKLIVGSLSGARAFIANYVGSSGAVDLMDVTIITDATIQSVSRAANIAVVNTTSAHGYSSGDRVVVNCSDNTFNDFSGVIITKIDNNSFSYANAGTDQSTTTETGVVGKSFDSSENLFYDNATPATQVTISVESGEYFEDFPIRVPTNCSIVGDELRRVIIRPLNRISQSPWRQVYFYRDLSIDGLTATSQNYGYHYLSNPANRNSQAKNNKDIDVFLMNDATSLMHMTFAGHGGFVVVLDPEGQIKTKSPYVQNCSSISASLNKKALRGGMFIDGFLSRMPVTVSGNYSNDTTIVVTGPSAKVVRPFTSITSILPGMPTSFFIRGVRYQVNAITSVSGGTNSVPTTTLTLLLETPYTGSDGDTIILETAGNKSALATHFTQINDLAYGCVVVNNGITELVSVYTYYNHTAYYSLNGGQIRAVNGSNACGFFGLKSEGSDPLEVPRPIKLLDNLVQIAKVYKRGAFDSSTYSSEQSGSIVVRNFDYIPYSVTEFEVNHPVAGRTSYVASNVSMVKNSIAIVGSDRTSNVVTVSTIIPHGFITGDTVIITGVTGPANSYNGSFTVTYVNPTTFTYSSTGADDEGSGGTATADIKLAKLNLGSGLSGGAELIEDLADGDFVVLRSNQNFKFSGNFNNINTRPSTALEFSNDGENRAYRTIALTTTYYDNALTPSDSQYGISESITPNNIISVDNNFNYINMTLVEDAVGGDTTIVISNLAAADATRVIGYEFGWVDQNVTQKGFKRTVNAYSANTPVSGHATVTLNSALPANTLIGLGKSVTAGIKASQTTTLSTSISSSSTPTTIELNNTNNFSNNGYIQIGNEYFKYTSNNRGTDTLGGITRAQLGSLEEDHTSGDTVSELGGLITTNISTTRATGHDFFNIGTGGYNTSNIPSNIFGEPLEAKVDSGSAIDSNGSNSKAEVQEKTKGRVFFSSTNQDGFFRVGRFFTVDQGTGTVSFNASIVLTNIDGLGFKRGISISEFSNDSSMPDLGDAVPTSSAVRSYLSRRLGFDDIGSIDTNPIGPGVVPLDGSIAMTGDLDLGLNKIVNVSTPIIGTDGANKSYVDLMAALHDTLDELTDVTLTSPTNASLLTFTGTGNNSVNAAVTGDVTFTRSGNTLTSAIAANSILNADVNSAAGIAQSKLTLNASDTRANATGITQGDLGVASFNATEFTATNGWISLAAGGIGNSRLVNSSVTIGSTGISLGSTVTTIAGLGSVTSTSFTGNLTGNVTGTASLATNVDVRVRNSTNAVHYLTFAELVSGSQRINTDTGLTYNPSTNTMTILGNILPGANSPSDSGQNIGSSSNKWNTVYATVFNGTATQAQYADLAENYLGDADYAPGTVLIFGGTSEVTACNVKADRRVVGVVTTNPAHLMNSTLVGDHVVSVALVGRVPCQVIGRVSKGDILVTSAVPGYAIVDNYPGVGTVVGKAISEKTDDGRGVVEALVGK